MIEKIGGRIAPSDSTESLHVNGMVKIYFRVARWIIAGLSRPSFISVRRRRASISSSGRSTRRSSMIFFAARKKYNPTIGSIQPSLLTQRLGGL